MSLKERWQETAFQKRSKKDEELFWADYLLKEQKIYEDILENKISEMKGILSELAQKYNMSNEFFCGFLDGISGALPQPVNLDALDENSEIVLNIDFEKLYKEMVEYKADHLYNLPQWKSILSEEKRKELYLAQKKSKTIVKEEKIGRNDPCPCGSGKKYKKCCGAK